MERWLTEKSRFKGRVLSQVSAFNIVDARKLTTCLLASSFIVASLSSSDADALGIGVAQTDSYIGEHLSVSIPLFNVVDPNSLSINFQSRQFDGAGQAKVNAVLDRSNSQLSIKLSSDSVVNEPYVSFKLDLVDNNTEFSKEFIVLMDLRSVGTTIDAESAFGRSVTANTQTVSGDTSLMGPYDTAQAGRIPKKFGAVLDGQSLWRVARRINEAMGVTRSQMIWSLYQANPNAFSSRSVSSLKAGSFLTIPDESVVKAVSDAQAKAKLAELRLGSSQLGIPKLGEPVTVATTSNDGAKEFGLNQEVLGSNDKSNDTQTRDQAAIESQFQVTGIDMASPNSPVSDESQSRQIISSLTETVGNLSQQLILKDQKIEFLEQQVNELKSFIGEEGVAQLSGTTNSEQPIEPVPTVSGLEAAITAQAPPSGSDSGSGLEVASLSDQSAQATPIWQWFLLGFFALSVFAYFMRDRFLEILHSLNLFGSKDQVEFNSVAIQDVDKAYIQTYQEAAREPKLDGSEKAVANNTGKNYSIMSAVENSMANKDVLDGISYLDLADDGSYEENEILEFDAQEISEGIEDLSFDERFERLLAENDFDFARELLDFARYNEINDERYHCERLRLFEKMKDEDGFYEYYYEIESKIPAFPQNLQTQISQLVVQLAHN